MLVSKVGMYITADTNLMVLYFHFPFQTSKALFSSCRESESKVPTVADMQGAGASINSATRRSLFMQQVSFTTDLPAE